MRHGMLQALGEVVMFTDADLSAPMEEAERLFAAIAAGADIAIGSRWLENGRQTHRQPLYRQFFGRCFNAVSRMVMGLHFADTQCGFKAFTRAAAQTVFQLQTIERWGFDPEILFIALKRGFRVVEVPVSWAHDERTRMSYLRDGLQMLKELAIIRWNALPGTTTSTLKRFSAPAKRARAYALSVHSLDFERAWYFNAGCGEIVETARASASRTTSPSCPYMFRDDRQRGVMEPHRIRWTRLKAGAVYLRLHLAI